MKIRQQKRANGRTKGFRQMLAIGLLGMVWLLIPEALGASRPAKSQRTPTARPSVSAGANSTNLSGLAAFNIIAERNIFNPNRGPRSSETASERPVPKVVKVETVTLKGTLIHGNGMIAFFDGSGSSFNKAVKPSDTIAGCKVKAVGPDSVWLEVGGKELEMKVGMQMRRQDEGEWKLSGRAEPATQSVAAGGSSSKSSGEDSGGAGDEDDVVKKLMERRAKENRE